MPFTVYPKKYAHGFCSAVLCCGYTLTDFPISIRLTSLALWQSNDCPSASKATLMNMDKYFMWIHYERLHNHNKAKHNKTVCLFLGIYCINPWVCWFRSKWINPSQPCDGMGLLPDTQNCGCACAGNVGNVFPVTTGKWSQHASRHVRQSAAGENFPGIPGACATCNFTYLVRGPYSSMTTYIWVILSSDNGLLPDSIKPLPEPIPTSLVMMFCGNHPITWE